MESTEDSFGTDKRSGSTTSVSSENVSMPLDKPYYLGYNEDISSSPEPLKKNRKFTISGSKSDLTDVIEYFQGKDLDGDSSSCDGIQR
ncbi:unnamed protein product [Allacma fusca]|uniref:Uncharacterized protein n=1 Tax=Allacma fusca TaxID=39272 RepID=A0A8J2P6G0_9HEXA|nr:unnamed protein product [Allacma fusca]